MQAARPDGAALTPGTTIAQARIAVAHTFRRAGLESPELDARVLIGHALQVDQAGLAAGSERSLSGSDVQRLGEFVARRLAREPVARIVGYKEFWGLDLAVTDATLVPRPETETVVEAALAAVDTGGPRSRSLRIADLGTGTGALLIALLTELPNASGVATDTSLDALAVARGNAERHGVSARAGFAVCDFGTALDGGFDVVVSNPPYIASGEIGALPAEVLRDPPRALDGGADGLDCYRAIVAQTPQWLAPAGHLVVELGAGQQQAVAALCTKAGLMVTGVRKDLAGIARALTAVLPQSRHEH
jgi:release factor glutamine methyltransferase